MSSETIDFSLARTAIDALLGELPELCGLTDLHVQGGAATVRIRGEVSPVELGCDLDYAVADLAALTASALRREISARYGRNWP